MLSRTGIYALQATLNLARHTNGRRVRALDVARELDVPANYLAKVLQRLGHEGIVEGVRGPGGGYRLVASPSELSVAEVVAPFQEMEPRLRCLMGGTCDPRSPCPAHRRREAWNRAFLNLLRETTLADLLGHADTDTHEDAS